MITVSVTLVYDNGDQKSVEVPHGYTVSQLASQIGAPSGCSYRVNRETVNGDKVLGNGDSVILNKVKYDAGC